MNLRKIEDFRDFRKYASGEPLNKTKHLRETRNLGFEDFQPFAGGSIAASKNGLL